MARFARWQMHWVLPVAAFAAVLLQASPITIARAAGPEPLPVLTRVGPVPPGLIDLPWRVPDNSAAKYFEPQLMAMWAVAEMGQADRPTIDALIDRAMRESDPLWLRMDAVGALTALTGARHGANFAAWKTWSGR